VVELFSNRLEYLDSLFGDFGPDAVAGQDCEIELCHQVLLFDSLCLVCSISPPAAISSLMNSG